MSNSETGLEVNTALEKSYLFVRWLIPTVEKFPRTQKFLLGDRMQSMALDLLERLIEATYSKSRSNILQKANLLVEKLRFMFRLAFERRYLDQRRYEYAARQLFEIGSMIGGWRKAHAEAAR